MLIDLWGTVHDGTTAYPDALACLARLAAAGCRVGLLSNAPRPAACEADRLARLGIGPQLYAGLFTAGEACREHLAAEQQAGTGRLLHVGPRANLCLFEGLAVALAAGIGEADSLIVTDLDPGLGGLDGHRGLLQAALARGLPMLCVNPDREAVTAGGRRVPRAGAVGHLYREMGGEVSWFGKPEASAFRRALAGLGGSPAGQVLVVGDNVETDIAGAARFGLASALVVPGCEPEADAARLAPLLPAGCLLLPALRW
jgi:HAD superfamily hydrolase (TIGR01459 family)